MQGTTLTCRRRWRGGLLSLVLFWGLGQAQAADRFVSSRGSDTANTCLSSLTPCRTLGHALTQAASGDILKVARGGYQGELAIDSSTTLTFSGGWTTDFSSWDPVTNKTTVRGKNGSVFSIEARAGEVLKITLDGLILIGGRAEQGGGIATRAFEDGSVTVDVTNSTILNNHADFDGGGIAVESSGSSVLHLRLTNSLLKHNRTFGFGGGVEVVARDSSVLNVLLTNSLLASNNADLLGGAMDTSSSGNSSLFVTLNNSMLRKNTAFNDGGGINAFSDDNSSLDLALTNSSVTTNTAELFTGGGIDVASAGSSSFILALNNSTIADNKAGEQGGGISGESDDNSILSLNLTNCIVTNNRTRTDGGGIATLAFGGNSLNLALFNSTITNNAAAADGGGMATQAGFGTHSVTLTNTILWGNRAKGQGEDLFMRQGLLSGPLTVDAAYNDIGDRATLLGSFNDLGGNINADPFFVNRRRDVHLTAASPAIDAGTCVGAPVTDFEGDPRPTGAGCDMGADEFVP